MIKNSRQSLLGLLCTFTLALFSTPVAFGQHNSSQSVDLKNLKSLQAEIQMNAGVLKITTQNPAKADSRFTYTREAWKPQVNFKTQGSQGNLTIKQPEEKNTNMQDKDRNEWEIKLPQAVPSHLKLRMGAGQGAIDLHGAKVESLELEAGAGEFRVNLANTSVSSLKINAGVGELFVDLTGNRTTDLQASLNGGIGDLNLVLPRKTGVRVKVNGLGSLDNQGLKKQGNYYVNDAYGKTPHSLEITVNGGLGSLELALEK
jgi:hypothetical protein